MFDWDKAVENGKKTSPAKVLAGEYEEFFGHPKSTLRAGNCPKCETPLEIGLALQGQERPHGLRVEYDFKFNSDLEFARCLKCSACGYSETLK
jgi:hypothetical protein